MAERTVIYPPPFWADYRRHHAEIVGVLDPRCYSIDWLDLQILNGDARVFGNDDAVIVVVVKQYPAGATELHGLVAAGALAGILKLITEAEDWARGQGVTFACVESRPGWERILKKRGFRLHQVSVRKDL